jgi:hypothetical protein
MNYKIQITMKISCATNGRQANSKENSYNPKRKRNIGRSQLRWRDQHTLQEDGTDHLWCNPVVLKLWGTTPRGGEGLERGAQHTFLQIKIKTALNQLEKMQKIKIHTEKLLMSTGF